MLPKHSRKLTEGNLQRVRRLRREMSVSEQTLWAWIRKKKLGFLFHRQYPVLDFVLDFYCPEARLAVEVDGEQHAFTVERDCIRDAKMAELGIYTLRVPSLDLFDPTGAAFSGWLREIVRLCEERTGRVVWPNGLHL